jgi:hypothetical protein
MIFEGPFTPNCMVDTFVASEKVGEGGPGDVVRRELNDRPRCDLVAIGHEEELRKCDNLEALLGLPFLSCLPYKSIPV